MKELPRPEFDYRTARLIPLVVFLFAVGAFIKNGYSVFDFPLDDGWIHRVYSRSFAFGHGFAYNNGTQEAGSTSPLWTIVTAPAHWLEPFGTRAVVAAVKLVGVLCGALTLMAAGVLATGLSGSLIGGAVGASLFALEPRLLFSCLSGMETSLLLALWTSAHAASLRGRHGLAVVLFGLMPVTRPEAAALMPFVLPSLVQLQRSRGIRAAAGTAALALAPSLLWVGFCLHTTGHPLPNTYYLKATTFALGAPQLVTAWRAVFLHGLAPSWTFTAGAAGCVAAGLRRAGRAAGGGQLFLMAGAATAYLCAVVGSRPLYLQDYYWARWVDPASVMFSLLFCIGCATLVAAALGGFVAQVDGKRPTRRIYPVDAVAGIAVAAALALTLPFFLRSFADRRGHLASDSRAIRIMNVAAGEWIRDNTPSTAVVAVNDAGAIRYFGRRHTIDLMGLNYAPVAFNRFEATSLLAKVDWIAIFPTWFRDTPFAPLIKRDFQVRHRISIPLQEYTVMEVIEQTLIVIAERTAARSPFDPAPNR